MIENAARAAIDLGHRHIVHPWLTQGEAQKDREIAHERGLELMKKLQANSVAMWLMAGVFNYRDPILETEFAGVRGPNPLGIAAGFDKNFQVTDFLGRALGFGFVTGGSTTSIAYDGNARPRVFDLPNNNSLINRMGFPGQGVEQAKRALRNNSGWREHVLVVNTAASKPSFDAGKAIDDYADAFYQMLFYGEIGEINVSSPNTPGVKGLQEPEVFVDLAQRIRDVHKLSPVVRHLPVVRRPLVYKFGPDLPQDKLEADLKIVQDNGGDGVCLTNTTVSSEIRSKLRPDTHKDEMGGMSGHCLTSHALEVSHRAYKYLGESLPIKRAGGVMSSKDLWNALTYGGATTVDILTAFVRPDTSTPNLSYYWLRDLAKAMRMMGMKSMADFASLRGKRVPYPLS